MAEITKSKKHHVSMGNYEFVEFEASVTLTIPPNADGTVGGTEISKAFADADTLLDAALEKDIVNAWDATTEEDSYIGAHPLNYVPPEPTPRNKRGRR